MICALYIRVSTDDQLEFSPEAQKRALIEYAKRNNYQIDERYIFIDEGISGTSAKKRPAFMRMITVAKSKPKPFDVILVHKFDRFARSREDSVVYKSLLKRECDIKVVSITEQLNDDKFDIILEAMLEAMAEYYSLNLSEEVIKGMTEKAMRGQAQASPPYGYKIENKQYVIDEKQAETVRYIFSLFAIEKMSAFGIAKHLNNTGVANLKTGKWTSAYIRRMLDNPSYIGNLRWNYKSRNKNGTQVVNKEEDWIIYENAHDPIIDIDLWDKTQLRLKLTSISNKRPAKYNITHFLSGIIRCAYCGGTLVSYFDKNKTFYFQCGNYRRATCKYSNSMKAETFKEYLKEILKRDLEVLSSSKIEKVNIESDLKNTEIENFKKRLSSIANKYDLAKRSFLSGIDTMEEYAENKKIIKEEENNILCEIEKIKNRTDVSPIVSSIQNFLDIIDDDNVPPKEKNELLKSFVSSITFDKYNEVFKVNYYL